jgi:hypothetical protein
LARRKIKARGAEICFAGRAAAISDLEVQSNRVLLLLAVVADKRDARTEISFRRRNGRRLAL